MSAHPTDPIANLQALLRCPSVTPAEGGALDCLEAMLSPLGMQVERPIFTDEDTPDIENLYARLSNSARNDGPHLMFAGHTDVVPIGDEATWTHPPFGAVIDGGKLYGRGAVDMKGGIACFVAALARVIEEDGPLSGSVSLLITGDEEGPAINGSEKLLRWAADRGERWDACIVGEPSNPNQIGDAIKTGRRGSLSGKISVKGVQGHVAYPHLAQNPARGIVALADALLSVPFDAGSDQFQPTNLEIVTIDIGNPAVNVIPASASASFNCRFNDHWTAESLQAEILRRLNEAAQKGAALGPHIDHVAFEVIWKERPSHVFLTKDDALIGSMTSAIDAVIGRKPEISTGGGTSDARFIKDYCPVLEFGLVGQTMHMVDEHVDIADLETLTQIYAQFMRTWFAR